MTINQIKQAKVVRLPDPPPWPPGKFITIEMDGWTGQVECHPDYEPEIGDTCWIRVDDQAPLLPPRLYALDKVRPSASEDDELVALFHGNVQVTEWVPLSSGKAPVLDEYLAGGKNRVRNLPFLQLRTQRGGTVAADTGVQEHVVTTYAITWRAVW